MTVYFRFLALTWLGSSISQVRAGWYYDASCDKYKSQLNNAMPQAFAMAEAAFDAIGTESDQAGKLWKFPDPEAMDLTGRIFGTLATTQNANKYHQIRNSYKYILDNFRNKDDKGDPDNKALGKEAPKENVWQQLDEKDIVLYCDMSRLKKTENTDPPVWYDENNPYDTAMSQEAYDKCMGKPVNGFVTAASTARPRDLEMTTIQLCLWWIDKEQNPKAWETLQDIKVKEETSMDKLEAWCKDTFTSQPKPPKNPVVDEFALTETTLLHEMTHAVFTNHLERDEDPGAPPPTPKAPNEIQKTTNDIGPGGGYGWSNIRNLKDGEGYNNADSLAYFGLLARILRERGYRIKADGCPEKVKKGWRFVLPRPPGSDQHIDASWTGPTTKRDLGEDADISNAKDHRLHRDPVRRANKPPVSPLYPLKGRQVNPSVGTGTAVSPIGTAISTLSSSVGAGIPTGTAISSSFSTQSSSPSQQSDSLQTSSTGSATTTIRGTTESTSTVESTTMASSTSLRSPGGVESSTSGTESTGPQSKSSSQGSASDTTSTTTTSTTATSISTSSALQSSTSVQGLTGIPVQSATSTSAGLPSLTGSETVSSTKDIAGLLSSFWQQTPTAGSTPTDSSNLFCTDESLIGCVLPKGFALEKQANHIDVYIPEVTDLDLFPVVKMKNPKPNLPDIPFVKAKLSDDKCKPLDKPSGGGLFGGIFNIASKAVNAVFDAACNIEYPVVKGDTPDIDYGHFPDPKSFPPAPGRPSNPEEPKPSDPDASKSSSKPSSTSSTSSSCSATAIPSCDITNFISGTIMQTGVTSCTTTTACSGAGITRETGITSTCTQTAIPSCRGTNLVSGSETTFFTTECSTTSACSGFGITSVTDITASATPTGTRFDHPEGKDEANEHQCALSVLFPDSGEIDEAAYSSCFGEVFTPGPTTTDAPVTTTSDSSITATDSATTKGSTATSISESASASQSQSASATSKSASEVNSPSKTPTPSPTDPEPSPSSAPPSSVPPPLPSQGRICFGTANVQWMGRDALNDAINTFCVEAEKQGDHDKDSGSLRREYNNNGPDHVIISMDWPSNSFKPNKNECLKHLGHIMDTCDGNEPTNPLNWKHGGYNQVGEVRYNIFPQAKKYWHGTCHMHIYEHISWKGIDGPGTKRTWYFKVRPDVQDGAGHSWTGSHGEQWDAGDGNPAKVYGLYDTLYLTPEAAGGKGGYIQFSIGKQSWTTKDKNGVPRCQVGDTSSDYSPTGRDMDCWFHC